MFAGILTKLNFRKAAQLNDNKIRLNFVETLSFEYLPYKNLNDHEFFYDFGHDGGLLVKILTIGVSK